MPEGRPDLDQKYGDDGKSDRSACTVWSSLEMVLSGWFLLFHCGVDTHTNPQTRLSLPLSFASLALLLIEVRSAIVFVPDGELSGPCSSGYFSGDVDSDGFVDLISKSGGLWRGLGVRTTSWFASESLEAVTNVGGILDLNRDNLVDFMISGSDTVSYRLQTTDLLPDGSYFEDSVQATGFSAMGATYTTVTVGYFNDDALLDVLCTGLGVPMLLLGQDTPEVLEHYDTIGTNEQLPNLSIDIVSPLSVDLNGDGHTDVLARDHATGRTQHIAWGPPPFETPLASFNTPCVSPISWIEVVDINRDGVPDLVGHCGTQLFWSEGGAAGAFSDPSLLYTEALFAELGDLDADSTWIEVAFVPTAAPSQLHIAVLMEDTDGLFFSTDLSPVWESTEEESIVALHTTDFDGDGDGDLVLCLEGLSTETSAVLMNAACEDFDQDGMSVCEGDCDDLDSSLTTDCPNPWVRVVIIVSASLTAVAAAVFGFSTLKTSPPTLDPTTSDVVFEDPAPSDSPGGSTTGGDDPAL